MLVNEVEQLKRYKLIIELVEYILSERTMGNRTDYWVAILSKHIDNCEYTDPKLKGTTGNPLAGVVKMLDNQLPDTMILPHVSDAKKFYDAEFASVIQANSGWYVKALNNIGQQAVVLARFGLVGALYGVDFAFNGLNVHVFTNSNNPLLAAQLKSILDAI